MRERRLRVRVKVRVRARVRARVRFRDRDRDRDRVKGEPISHRFHTPQDPTPHKIPHRPPPAPHATAHGLRSFTTPISSAIMATLPFRRIGCLEPSRTARAGHQPTRPRKRIK